MPRPVTAIHAAARLAAVLLLLSAAPLARGGADEAPEGYERWYLLELGDQKVGHIREARSVDEEGRIVTDMSSAMSVARGDQAVIEVDMRSSFTETPDGEPVRIEASMKFGADRTTWIFIFDEDGVTRLTDNAGRRTRARIDRPKGDWLTPAEVESFISARLEAGADVITYATIDASTGDLTPMLMKHTVLDREARVEAGGKTVPAIKTLSTTSRAPGVETTEWIDAEGRMVRGELNMGAFRFDILPVDEAEALAAFDAPELMASTLVEPDRPIEDPRATVRAVYTVRSINGELPDLPTTGAQRVERLGPGELRITVDLEDAVPLDPAQPLDPRYTEPSTMVDSSDPEIIALVEKATAEAGEDPLERARAMRTFVDRYIEKKSLGVGFASASDVCRTREGDCSEHAALLAAMLRADGIPARTASGLIYVDFFIGRPEVFGYHMWTQGLFDRPGGGKAWIDLDAAMGEDATHITVATSALSDDDVVNSMVAIAQMMNNLEIAVESVGRGAGEPASVGEAR